MKIQDLDFKRLDGEITANTPEEFYEQFRAILKTNTSQECSSIVYRWCTQNSIPRLKGESPVIYIGKTSYSLFKRHHQYVKIESSGNNWLRYGHIIKNYGSITFECAQCDNSKEMEKMLIRDYFERHLEVPPVNYSS